ncbi:hypothetical protein ACIGEZ_24075 [Streptomyces sp. NPDC085481]|uniref:hypothetical protein n=1 Tax=Streptomyces sp. NPDC085481 TaxID=3365727 RepID=UPI0037D7BC66
MNGRTGVDVGEPASERRLYRSNPRYVLRGLDDLDPSQRQAVAGSSSRPTVAGLLLPAGAEHGTIKAVSQSMARLFEQLAAPCWLPSPTWPALSAEELGDLVGAEVLEVQVADRFVTGVEALAELAPGRPAPPVGRLAALSSDAIAYAESLHLDAQADIAARLYAFHRVAIRPAWRTTEYGDAFRTRMNRAMPHGLGSGPRWVEGPHRPWRTCRRRDVQARAGQPTLKLYISPTPDHLADTVAAAVPLLAEAPGVIGWKVADTVGVMVRPDKFVVYLASERALRDLAGELSPVLAGTGVHGVPFTCESGLDGLLSWGLDPVPSPDGPHVLVDSWRTWVTARLAGGLVQARRAGLTGRQAHSAALQRARAAGVDPSTWQPTSEPVRACEGSAL